MGLIDRLNGPADSDSLFGRAFALRDSRPLVPEADTPAPSPTPDPDAPITPLPRREARDTPAPAVGVDAGAAIRSLLKELQTQRSYGITTPSHLFSLLHRHLAIERGALLVPAAEGEHLPLATAGLDRTSALRLRMTEDELHELITDRKPVLVTGSQRGLFESRLSRADFRRSPRIVLFPFFHVKRILATLVVFGSPILELDPTALDVILGALTDSAGKLLFDGRQRAFGDRTRSVVLRRPQSADAVARMMRRVEAEGHRVEAIETDLAPLAERIRQVHPLLDNDRLLSDMVDTAGLLLSGSHNVIHSGTSRIVFVGPSLPSHDPELLMHLVSTTVSHLFGIGSPVILEHRELSDAEIRKLSEA